MLYMALVALLIALVFGALGYGGIVGGPIGLAGSLFYVFILLFLILLAAALVRRLSTPKGESTRDQGR